MPYLSKTAKQHPVVYVRLSLGFMGVVALLIHTLLKGIGESLIYGPAALVGIVWLCWGILGLYRSGQTQYYLTTAHWLTITVLLFILAVEMISSHGVATFFSRILLAVEWFLTVGVLIAAVSFVLGREKQGLPLAAAAASAEK